MNRATGRHRSCLLMELTQDRDVGHQIYRLDVLDARLTSQMVRDLLAIALARPEHDPGPTQVTDQEPLEPSSAIMAITQPLLKLRGRFGDAFAAGPVLDLQEIDAPGFSSEEEVSNGCDGLDCDR